jgi:SAM-dependent methyltransferase
MEITEAHESGHGTADPHRIKARVLEMYLQHPYPNYNAAQRRQYFPAELMRYRYLGFEPHMPGARFLDVGCGTGDRSMLACKHYGVKEFVGLDHSSASLAIAREHAKEEGFDRFRGVEGNVLELPFPDASFDIAVSWGVLHHTSDAYRGFRELVRVCRPGGFVGIYLYNLYGHWRHNMQKAKVSRLGGADIDKRFEVAHRLYGEKPASEMSPDEVASFYDKYCHPHKTDHTIRETLEWFDSMNCEYTGSYPPLLIGDGIACMQYRATMMDEYPVVRPRNRIACRLASKLPSLGQEKTQYARPGLASRILWQAGWAWMGRHGKYSMGSAMGARKR